MKYLINSGGKIKSGFGLLITPGTYGIPEGLKAGTPWGADNQAYTRGFNPIKYFDWLHRLEDYKNTCLFAVSPDIVGNAAATIDLFHSYRERFTSWPVAFVAQDGQERIDFPDQESWQCLFVGGTTEWKLSPAAVECIQRAQAINKHIHIGRVNWFRRFQYFASLPGSERFTCDGTRHRFGRNKAEHD